MSTENWPTIIQGGMGVAISGRRLARTVSLAGQFGVVSGTGVAIILMRDLWEGDLDGACRRALRAFPDQGVVERVLDRYYNEGGPDGRPCPHTKFYSLNTSPETLELTVASAFVEVWLAKEGHPGKIGFNLLEKTPIPNLSALYGAMLAKVDAIIMGAGLPLRIPGVLQAYSQHQAGRYPLEVVGAAEGEIHHTVFDPAQVIADLSALQPLPVPAFFPIVTAPVTALALIKRSNGPVDGFIVETPVAGGHNAPPRGQYKFNEKGEPIYGPKDFARPEAFRRFELPYWMAGGYGNREGLKLALEGGANGIQVGTAFAYSEESGFDPALRNAVLDQVRRSRIEIRTDARASPTGFPFKVVPVPGTMSDAEVAAARPRVCDLGYLRHLYKREDGSLGFRCPSEPAEAWLKKGGAPEELEGRLCLCNALVRDIGVRLKKKDGYVEPALVTSGDAVTKVSLYMRPGQISYSALDVLDVLLGKREASPSTAHTETIPV